MTTATTTMPSSKTVQLQPTKIKWCRHRNSSCRMAKNQSYYSEIMMMEMNNNNIHRKKCSNCQPIGLGYIGNVMLFGDEGQHVVYWQEWYVIYIPDQKSQYSSARFGSVRFDDGASCACVQNTLGSDRYCYNIDYQPRIEQIDIKLKIIMWMIL